MAVVWVVNFVYLRPDPIARIFLYSSLPYQNGSKWKISETISIMETFKRLNISHGITFVLPNFPKAVQLVILFMITFLVTRGFIYSWEQSKDPLLMKEKLKISKGPATGWIRTQEPCIMRRVLYRCVYNHWPFLIKTCVLRITQLLWRDEFRRYAQFFLQENITSNLWTFTFKKALSRNHETLYSSPVLNLPRVPCALRLVR